MTEGTDRPSIQAGWYADPWNPGQLRLWDGDAWTAQVAPAAPQAQAAAQLPAAGGLDRSFVRRVLWMSYASLMTVTLLFAGVALIREEPLWGTVDFFVSLPTLIAMFLYTWDVRVLRPWVWRAYVPVYAVWMVIYNVIILPDAPTADVVLGLTMQAPMYYALIKYSLGSWGAQNETSTDA